MATGNSNELMQEGIKQVKAGNNPQAYNIFKQVASQEPNNEFAWIWISVTSEDRLEKRAALEHALTINPDSQHAREALRALDAEDGKTVANPTAKVNLGKIGEGETRQNPIPPVQPIGSNDDLRAALTSDNKKKKPDKAQTVTNAKTSKSTSVAVSPKKAGGGGRLLVSLLVLAILVVAIAAAAFYVVTQTTPKTVVDTQAQTSPVPADSPVVTTTTTTDVGSPAALTTTNATAIAPVGTASPIAANPVTVTNPTTVPVSNTNPTTVPNTTVATTGANPVTVINPTTVPVSNTNPTLATTSSATAEPAAPQNPNQAQPTLPAGTAGLAQSLQAAHDSQVAGDYKAAIETYGLVLQNDPRNVPANLGLGNAYLTAPSDSLPSKTDRYGAAAQAFQNVVKQAPNWAGGYARLGEALAGQGQTKPAITAFSKSLELDPNGAERWLALAALYDKDNQPEQARLARERGTGLIKASPTATPKV